MQQAPELTIHDPIFKGKTTHNFVNRLALRYIRDERDLPFIHLILKIVFLIAPVAFYLFLPNCFSWWIAVPYLIINMLVFLGPFILMLHNTSHRPFFKKEYPLLNRFIPWILGPLYGESPDTYFCHHIGMHHAENNLPKDLSSTMWYQRDSLKDFLYYFYKFFFFSLVDLYRYFTNKNRKVFIKKMLLGELSFILMCVILLFVNWKATLMVFILPFVIARFGMMAGNWAQHAFIDPSDAGNNYKNSITCINSIYNRRCFNDGYHIGHHLRPSMHWTDMPQDFLDNQDKYIANQAVVFEKLDYFVIWFLLMTKNYNTLANYFVDLGNTFNNKAEIVDFLKQRVQKISPEQLEQYQ